MIKNPEFIKNIQLELNPVKLISMPVILSMVFFVSYLMVIEAKEPAAPFLQVISIVFFGIIVFAWGTKMAIESLVSEFNDKTWDSQRMTAIGPWALAWGKLLGSTLFTWYGGLFCLLLFAFSSLVAEEPHHLFKILLIIIFLGFFVQTAIFAFILNEFNKNRDSAKLAISSYSIASVLLMLQLMPFTISAYHAQKNMQWYGVKLHPIDIVLYSSLFFCLWGAVGMYRAMRKELQFENSPLVWTFFVISLMAYFSGFIFSNHDITNDYRVLLFLCLLQAFAIGIVSFYLMVFVETKNIFDVKIMIDKTRKKEWAGLFLKIPAWFMSLLLSAVFCFVLLIMQWTTNIVSSIESNDLNIFLKFSPLSLLLFCLRDLGIILYINWNSAKKNRDITAAFYIGIMYILIPTMLSIAGSASILPWFIPLVSASFLNGIVPIAIQAGLVLYLVGKKLAMLTVERI